MKIIKVPVYSSGWFISEPPGWPQKSCHHINKQTMQHVCLNAKHILPCCFLGLLHVKQCLSRESFKDILIISIGTKCPENGQSTCKQTDTDRKCLKRGCEQ